MPACDRTSSGLVHAYWRRVVRSRPSDDCPSCTELIADKRAELTALSAFGQPPDERVPESRTERARELRGLVDATGHFEDRLGSRSADRLELGERTRQVKP